jgi:inhibitor of cysteine peptidase
MPDAISLGPDDNGRTVSVAKGQLVVLQLPENPTTGYRWVAAAHSSFELVSTTYTLGSSGIGAGGVRRFEWLATAPGRHELLLLHRQEWEPPGKEIGRFQITVTVQ